MWKVKKINDDSTKKAQLVIVLQDKALSWYIKYGTMNLVSSLVATKNTLNVEFKKPKSQSQCITKIKEIKQAIKQMAWGVDMRLKCLMGQANFQISDGLHKEWYMVVLLTHLRLLLSKQNIGRQAQALEIKIKLEASLVQETHIGVQQIQSWFKSLHKEL